jgi:non-specific serine/threonine protein kinase
VAIFSEQEIHKIAFGPVIENGRRCFEKKCVSGLHFSGDDIIAGVKGERLFRVVISRENGVLRFDCNCGFSLGGACEHVIAVMIAANSSNAIQTGIDWNSLEEDSSGNKEISDEPEEEPPEVIEVAGEKPRPRLYLSESDLMLLVELRFAYLNGTVEFSRFDSSSYRLVPEENGIVYKVIRSRARETSISSRLAEYDLVRYQTGVFTPSGDSRIWLLQELPRIAGDGFEIYGQENLRTINARSTAPKLSVAVTFREGIFDCEVSLSVGGIHASLAALIKAVKEKSRFVLLSDGSSGIIPEEWLERFAAIFSVLETDESQKVLRARPAHLPIADQLFEMADTRRADAEFEQKRLAFRNFSGVCKKRVPSGFKAEMRPYQAAGYDWFYFLKEYGFGGCLADDMGLGKTVQTLALLLNEKQEGGGQPSLIIVPASLLFNWQREAKKFVPELSLLLYHGPGREQYLGVMHMADAVLTTYGTILRDIEKLKEKNFHYIILDEAQAIKNPTSDISRVVKELQGSYRLALSGTPIENNLAELWSLFSFLNPGILGTLRSFAENFIRPIDKDQNEYAADSLRKLIFPFILRRTKEQVAKELPPKNEIVIYTEMLPRQRTLYEITRDIYRNRVQKSIENDDIERSRFQILEGLLRLRQICCHPVLVEPSFSGDSGKLRVVCERIQEITGEGHRVLVFSQFVKVLELTRKMISGYGISSEILTGATRDRKSVVDRFQNGTGGPVFFISLKAGGTGLNLTRADYVIHIDPWWNPGVENQASDRAHRIGQTRTVFVYKMITKDSIEERVMELQEKKRLLTDSVIQTETSFFKQLTIDNMLGLFG